MSTVLVTGGSGFIAGHTLLQLLAAGHDVRTTVRRLAQADAVKATLADAGADPRHLAFFAADLERDDGWADAITGCDYVLHMASPFPTGNVENEDEVVVPARDGTLRVLRAARAAGVKRVVLTSSFAAIGYGHPARARAFDEKDWTDLSAKLQPYIRSKTVAERAAWDFVASEGHGLELTVVNPVGVFGPILGPDLSSSIVLVQRMLNGEVPRVPKIYFGIVDVRDVADLHLRAMTAPDAAGERFLAVAGDCVSLFDVAQILRRHLGAAANRTPHHQVPNFVMRLAALRNPVARQVLPELGKIKNARNEKARHVLGWTPRSNEEAIAATADSLLRIGLVKPAAA